MHFSTSATAAVGSRRNPPASSGSRTRSGNRSGSSKPIQQQQQTMVDRLSTPRGNVAPPPPATAARRRTPSSRVQSNTGGRSASNAASGNGEIPIDEKLLQQATRNHQIIRNRQVRVDPSSSSVDLASSKPSRPLQQPVHQQPALETKRREPGLTESSRLEVGYRQGSSSSSSNGEEWSENHRLAPASRQDQQNITATRRGDVVEEFPFLPNVLNANWRATAGRRQLVQPHTLSSGEATTISSTAATPTSQPIGTPSMRTEHFSHRPTVGQRQETQQQHGVEISSAPAAIPQQTDTNETAPNNGKAGTKEEKEVKGPRRPTPEEELQLLRLRLEVLQAEKEARAEADAHSKLAHPNHNEDNGATNTSLGDLPSLAPLAAPAGSVNEEPTSKAPVETGMAEGGVVQEEAPPSSVPLAMTKRSHLRSFAMQVDALDLVRKSSMGVMTSSVHSAASSVVNSRASTPLGSRSVTPNELTNAHSQREEVAVGFEGLGQEEGSGTVSRAEEHVATSPSSVQVSNLSSADVSSRRQPPAHERTRSALTELPTTSNFYALDEPSPQRRRDAGNTNKESTGSGQRSQISTQDAQEESQVHTQPILSPITSHGGSPESEDMKNNRLGVTKQLFTSEDPMLDAPCADVESIRSEARPSSSSEGRRSGPSSTGSKRSSSVTCQHCSGLVASSARFCPSCGVAQHAEEESPVVPTAPDDSRRRLLIPHMSEAALDSLAAEQNSVTPLSLSRRQPPSPHKEDLEPGHSAVGKNEEDLTRHAADENLRTVEKKEIPEHSTSPRVRPPPHVVAPPLYPPGFSAEEYLSLHPDLQAQVALAPDRKTWAVNHWNQHGHKEGRAYSRSKERRTDHASSEGGDGPAASSTKLPPAAGQTPPLASRSTSTTPSLTHVDEESTTRMREQDEDTSEAMRQRQESENQPGTVEQEKLMDLTGPLASVERQEATTRTALGRDEKLAFERGLVKKHRAVWGLEVEKMQLVNQSEPQARERQVEADQQVALSTLSLLQVEHRAETAFCLTCRLATENFDRISMQSGFVVVRMELSAESLFIFQREASAVLAEMGLMCRHFLEFVLEPAARAGLEFEGATEREESQKASSTLAPQFLLSMAVTSDLLGKYSPRRERPVRQEIELVKKADPPSPAALPLSKPNSSRQGTPKRRETPPLSPISSSFSGIYMGGGGRSAAAKTPASVSAAPQPRSGANTRSSSLASSSGAPESVELETLHAREEDEDLVLVMKIRHEAHSIPETEECFEAEDFTEKFSSLGRQSESTRGAVERDEKAARTKWMRRHWTLRELEDRRNQLQVQETRDRIQLRHSHSTETGIHFLRFVVDQEEPIERRSGCEEPENRARVALGHLEEIASRDAGQLAAIFAAEEETRSVLMTASITQAHSLRVEAFLLSPEEPRGREGLDQSEVQRALLLAEHGHRLRSLVSSQTRTQMDESEDRQLIRQDQLSSGGGTEFPMEAILLAECGNRQVLETQLILQLHRLNGTRILVDTVKKCHGPGDPWDRVTAPDQKRCQELEFQEADARDLVATNWMAANEDVFQIRQLTLVGEAKGRREVSEQEAAALTHLELVASQQQVKYLQHQQAASPPRPCEESEGSPPPPTPAQVAQLQLDEWTLRFEIVESERRCRCQHGRHCVEEQVEPTSRSELTRTQDLDWQRWSTPLRAVMSLEASEMELRSNTTRSESGDRTLVSRLTEVQLREASRRETVAEDEALALEHCRLELLQFLVAPANLQVQTIQSSGTAQARLQATEYTERLTLAEGEHHSHWTEHRDFLELQLERSERLLVTQAEASAFSTNMVPNAPLLAGSPTSFANTTDSTTSKADRDRFEQMYLEANHDFERNHTLTTEGSGATSNGNGPDHSGGFLESGDSTGPPSVSGLPLGRNHPTDRRRSSMSSGSGSFGGKFDAAYLSASEAVDGNRVSRLLSQGGSTASSATGQVVPYTVPPAMTTGGGDPMASSENRRRTVGPSDSVAGAGPGDFDLLAPVNDSKRASLNCSETSAVLHFDLAYHQAGRDVGDASRRASTTDNSLSDSAAPSSATGLAAGGTSVILAPILPTSRIRNTSRSGSEGMSPPLTPRTMALFRLQQEEEDRRRGVSEVYYTVLMELVLIASRHLAVVSAREQRVETRSESSGLVSGGGTSTSGTTSTGTPTPNQTPSNQSNLSILQNTPPKARSDSSSSSTLRSQLEASERKRAEMEAELLEKHSLEEEVIRLRSRLATLGSGSGTTTSGSSSQGKQDGTNNRDHAAQKKKSKKEEQTKVLDQPPLRSPPEMRNFVAFEGAYTADAELLASVSSGGQASGRSSLSNTMRTGSSASSGAHGGVSGTGPRSPNRALGDQFERAYQETDRQLADTSGMFSQESGESTPSQGTSGGVPSPATSSVLAANFEAAYQQVDNQLNADIFSLSSQQGASGAFSQESSISLAGGGMGFAASSVTSGRTAAGLTTEPSHRSGYSSDRSGHSGLPTPGGGRARNLSGSQDRASSEQLLETFESAYRNVDQDVHDVLSEDVLSRGSHSSVPGSPGQDSQASSQTSHQGVTWVGEDSAHPGASAMSPPLRPGLGPAGPTRRPDSNNSSRRHSNTSTMAPLTVDETAEFALSPFSSSASLHNANSDLNLRSTVLPPSVATARSSKQSSSTNSQDGGSPQLLSVRGNSLKSTATSSGGNLTGASDSTNVPPPAATSPNSELLNSDALLSNSQELEQAAAGRPTRRDGCHASAEVTLVPPQDETHLAANPGPAVVVLNLPSVVLSPPEEAPDDAKTESSSSGSTPIIPSTAVIGSGGSHPHPTAAGPAVGLGSTGHGTLLPVVTGRLDLTSSIMDVVSEDGVESDSASTGSPLHAAGHRASGGSNDMMDEEEEDAELDALLAQLRHKKPAKKSTADGEGGEAECEDDEVGSEFDGRDIFITLEDLGIDPGTQETDMTELQRLHLKSFRSWRRQSFHHLLSASSSDMGNDPGSPLAQRRGERKDPGSPHGGQAVAGGGFLEPEPSFNGKVRPVDDEQLGRGHRGGSQNGGSDDDDDPNLLYEDVVIPPELEPYYEQLPDEGKKKLRRKLSVMHSNMMRSGSGLTSRGSDVGSNFPSSFMGTGKRPPPSPRQVLDGTSTPAGSVYSPSGRRKKVKLVDPMSTLEEPTATIPSAPSTNTSQGDNTIHQSAALTASSSDLAFGPDMSSFEGQEEDGGAENDSDDFCDQEDSVGRVVG